MGPPGLNLVHGRAGIWWPTGAENGALTVMIGGSQTDFDRVRHLMCSHVRALMGDVGTGQYKDGEPICIARLNPTLSEGLLCSRSWAWRSQGSDVISKGAAQSWQMENRYKTCSP